MNFRLFDRTYVVRRFYSNRLAGSAIAGVLVCPGDVVVADGDGVIVVPRVVAEKVALHAREILESDKAGRRRLYESLGRPLDQTVK